MTQVTRTTNDIVINSLFLIGELGVGETPDARMLSTGIELLNEIIDVFAADSIYIPFLTTLSFTMTPGVGTYSISDILLGATVNADRVVDLSFANYNVDTVVYPLQIINKATYYNHVRISNLTARPGFIFLDKQDTASFVTLFPIPDQAYPCELRCKVMIDKLDPFEDLTELPPFYYGFLKYALGRRFISYYPSGNWTPQAEEIYMDYFNTLKNANETDLTLRPTGVLDARQPYYWQQILAY